ncbi:head-tail adaptor [Pseudomonas phage AF]|uniref:head-tail adaptor n=1 Tax=Pseudomonas phage AF TaxID=1235689 RepID=UPI0002970ADA|nr:head-tail adaptor [Pseudomonas phage AF]AFV50620.1 putative head-to-tail-connector [Pseudomonas phage AF]
MPRIDAKEAERLTKKGQQLKAERDEKWLPKWKNQRDYLAPADGQFEGDLKNDGKRRDQRINNQKPVRSAKIGAAGMASGLASQSRPWILIQPPQGVPNNSAVQQWLYAVQMSIHGVLARSNFYNILPQVCHSEMVYGTGAMSALPDDEDVVRFYHYPVGTFALATSARGQIDTFYREYSMTPRQIVQQFGKDNCSAQVKLLAEQGQNTNICVCHLIEPNPDADMTKMDNRSMPWKSTYWEDGKQNECILRQSGFKSFPIMAPRWDVNGVNVYGTGPGDVAIGKSQELQLLEADKMRLVQLYARPSLTAPISIRGQGANTVPGGITWVPDNLVGAAMRPSYEPNPAALVNVRAEIAECEQDISEAFYEDLFLLISQSEGTMTAYEVAQRKEEKMLMLGPVVERNNDELFDPLIDQVFSIMYEASIPYWMGLREGEPLIPPPPEELQGVPLRVEYVSILSQAQKAVAASGIERAIQFTSLLAQAQPDAFDKINSDVAQEEYFTAIGVPPTLLRSQDEVNAIREARAQAQQQQIMAEQAAQMVDSAKTLSETPTTGDSALTAMIGAS